MQWVFVLSEWGIAVLFACCAGRARAVAHRDGGRSLSLLLSAALYAFLFEELNVVQGRGRGSYSYNAGFLVNFDRVPMFIVLAWAVILWSAMLLGDAAPPRERSRVAGEACLAVRLDLAFDATAIRFDRRARAHTAPERERAC